MMEGMAQDLVEVNRNILESAPQHISDGHYRLKAVVLPAGKLGAFHLEPMPLAMTADAFPVPEENVVGAIAIHRIEVPIMTDSLTSVLGTNRFGSLFGTGTVEVVIPTPLLLKTPPVQRSMPIGGGRALSHW